MRTAVVAWETPAERTVTLSLLYSDDRSIAGVAAASAAAAAAAGVAAAGGSGGPSVGTEAIGPGRWWSRIVSVVGTRHAYLVGRKQLANGIQKEKNKTRKIKE